MEHAKRGACPQVVTNNGVVTTNYIQNDHAVVNQGQLKLFTTKAVAELNADLPGGAGTNLNNMVSNWASDYATNGYSATNIKPSDYTAMNVGQLKYIGNKVWSRLVVEGFTNSPPPWLAKNVNSDYQLANLGQLKSLFNFDLTLDSDANGLPDWWELQYFGHLGNDPNSSPDGNGFTLIQDYLGGADPTNYYSQLGGAITPTFIIVSGNNQTNAQGQYTPQPLVVKVANGGVAMPNAPVIFSVATGEGLLATTIGSLNAGFSAQVNTDSNGFAQLFYEQPTDAPPVTSTITATTAGQTLTFTETSDNDAISTPVISRASGTSTVQFDVTLTDATSGATMYYTTDGSSPTADSTPVPVGGNVTVAATETLAVRALQAGYTPSAIASASYVITGQVAGGVNHTVALRTDGTVWTWGLNANGQLGLGNTTSSPTPAQVTSLSGITAVAAGSTHSLALKSDGTVWAWGNNTDGELGDGTTTPQTNPVQVSGLTNVIAISAGAFHSMALESDGTVWTWGLNTSNQLGDGTTTQRNTPVQVTTVSGITQISAGWYHNLALNGITGNVYAWGLNTNGQLGDGTTTSHSSAEQIMALSEITSVNAAALITVSR